MHHCGRLFSIFFCFVFVAPLRAAVCLFYFVVTHNFANPVSPKTNKNSAAPLGVAAPVAAAVPVAGAVPSAVAAPAAGVAAPAAAALLLLITHVALNETMCQSFQ